MKDQLKNPVYNALLTVDVGLGFGTGNVRCFHEAISPFAGFEVGYEDGFSELHTLLPSGRKILYAIEQPVEIPEDWILKAHIGGLQFILDKYRPNELQVPEMIPLGSEHVNEMIKLTTLTRPGPFDTRTIEFGSYYGIFQDNQLVAMTGQRLHLPDHTEISAVCTHPDHAGKGFAKALLQHQVEIILETGKTPFLHVRSDNEGAIALYEKVGFKVSRPMNFYFLKKK